LGGLGFNFFLTQGKDLAPQDFGREKTFPKKGFSLLGKPFPLKKGKDFWV